MCVGMNWVGMCFHDPLPSDVRRKNYIPSFSDFRQNPLNPKSPSEEKKKKKKIQSVSVELDLMKSRTTTSLFFFLQIRPCPKHGVPTSSSACRLSTLALSQIPVDGSQSTVQIFLFFLQNTPDQDLSGPVRQRDIQRQSAQKVIDSSDFLLFPPCDTRAGPEKGGVLVQRTTLDPRKYSVCGWKSQNKNKEHGGRGGYLRLRQSPPSPPGRFSPLLPLSGSLLLPLSSLPLVSRSVTAVAVLCYRKRCGPRSAATSSTPPHTHWCCVHGPLVSSDI